MNKEIEELAIIIGILFLFPFLMIIGMIAYPINVSERVLRKYL